MLLDLDVSNLLVRILACNLGHRLIRDKALLRRLFVDQPVMFAMHFFQEISRRLLLLNLLVEEVIRVLTADVVELWNHIASPSVEVVQHRPQVDRVFLVSLLLFRRQRV